MCVFTQIFVYTFVKGVQRTYEEGDNVTVFVPSADRNRGGPNRIIGNVVKVVGQKYKIRYFLLASSTIYVI